MKEIKYGGNIYPLPQEYDGLGVSNPRGQKNKIIPFVWGDGIGRALQSNPRAVELQNKYLNAEKRAMSEGLGTQPFFRIRNISKPKSG